jgi:hypothetical protein
VTPKGPMALVVQLTRLNGRCALSLQDTDIMI